MQHQTNGVSAPGAGSVSMLGGLPQAGQQMDINILYNLVLQLSEELAQNRLYVSTLVSSVQRLEARAAEDGASPTAAASTSAELSGGNGGATVDSSAAAAAAAATTSRHLTEVARLQNELAAANRTIATLTESNTAYSNLLLDHETALSSIIDKVRPYAHSHTDHTLALHRHYNGVIAQERKEKLDLRLEQQQWQAGLGRVAEYARLALREQSEGGARWGNRVARLKQENRILRKLANVEAGWESSEDEEEPAEGKQQQVAV